MSDGGKGSPPRPFSVSHDEWSSRWDAIFQKDIPNKDTSEATSEDKSDILQYNKGNEGDDKQ